MPPPEDRPEDAPVIAALSGLSRCLLDLHASADQPLGMQWVARALETLRPLVPFDRAWWGECSTGDASEPPLNWQHGSIGLAASFADEWNEIGSSDEFARATMGQLGVACRSSGHDSAGPAIEGFSRRHDLYHAMAVTLELPDSGLMFFVSLYRGDNEPAFDGLEATAFEAYCLHLRQIWHRRLQQLLRGPGRRAGEGFALAEATGRVVYLDHAFARALRHEFAGWQGHHLPPPLVRPAELLPATLRLGGQALTVAACGALLALSWGRRPSAPALAPRERAVAVLYAEGQSYKAIAARLDLSPATVRTYLRDAYLQLGVRNKVELGARLARDG
ncbi:LuxR C-terminal-related transcriptional regulator [Ideonella sp.]|uniref:helix-turn-helix transcriptional regulator n=1 Tax=Ideonella sp. TaxID=1929293 RepID=UPI0035AE9B01